jgi:alkanesulfonate monooxygenase SsuD/methylene tetrahydromethanopterin reductase-like flavin-dependent oxidoreductase (luciferase family)
MRLALYLPNFRNNVTVKELEDLTNLAEQLEFDSVWTLDRIVVPQASDREELQYSFGMMDEFPKALPVSSRGEWYQGWPLIPWLAARTSKVRIGMSITDTPYRAPGVLTAELATVDHLSNGRLNAGVGPVGCPRSSPQRAPRTSSRSGTRTCGRRSRSCRASGRTTCSSTTASSPTSTGAGSE